MTYQFLIIILVAPNLLLQVVVGTQNATTEASEPTTNSTSPAPKETSYFYRDPKGPGTYEFGYRIEDDATGNIQFRNETRHANGTVTGSYGYLRPDGKMTVTTYVADERGFRKKTKVSKGQKPSTTTATPSTTTTTAPTGLPGLNLNSGTLPPQLVEGVKDEYQIDLSPNADPSDILHPDIADIISGKVPLDSSKTDSKPGFEVVHGFIPNDFPIVPFELPTEMPDMEDID